MVDFFLVKEKSGAGGFHTIAWIPTLSSLSPIRMSAYLNLALDECEARLGASVILNKIVKEAPLRK